MSAGLFELRKDPITGWWVATIVDRDFDRSRFARPAAADRRRRRLPELPHPRGRRRSTPGPQGLRVPRRRHGGGARRARPGRRAADGLGRARRRQLADDRRAARASTGRSPRSAPLAEELLLVARDAIAEATRAAQTDYLQVVQNWGAQAGRPDEPPVPRPVRSAAHPTPGGRGARGRGQVRDPRRASARGAGSCARKHARASGSSGRTPRRSRSRRGARARRSRSGSCRATTRPISGAPTTRPSGRPPRRSARCSAAWPPASTARRTTSSCTRRRCASAWTRRSTGTGRSIPGCARSPAWSSGPGCPVNPVSPEAAVEELLERAGGAEAVR